MFLHKVRNMHFLLQCRQQNPSASITDGSIPSSPPLPESYGKFKNWTTSNVQITWLEKGNKEWKCKYCLKSLRVLLQQVSKTVQQVFNAWVWFVLNLIFSLLLISDSPTDSTQNLEFLLISFLITFPPSVIKSVATILPVRMSKILLLCRLFVLSVQQPKPHKMQVCMAKQPGHTRIFERESWSRNWEQVSCRDWTSKRSSTMGYLGKFHACSYL